MPVFDRLLALLETLGAARHIYLENCCGIWLQSRVQSAAINYGAYPSFLSHFRKIAPPETGQRENEGVGDRPSLPARPFEPRIDIYVDNFVEGAGSNWEVVLVALKRGAVG